MDLLTASQTLIPRPPYIKGKNYLVNKLVVNGIPKEADSRNYPRVIGTVAWEQFWSEELYKIRNGVQTGGLWVPGRYYYYMNYTVMNTIERGAINPDNTDLHLELAYYIDYCKKNGNNLMIPKGRRRGISEASHPMIIDYGYRFSEEKWQGGVAAGHSVPINDFITKWRFAETQLPPEFYIGKLSKGSGAGKEIIAGWTQKNELNSWEDKGTFNTIYLRTMGSDPNMFKGLFLNDVVVEEVGEFEDFLEFWDATKDCLMSNQKQIGSGFVYGTGGRIDKGSRDFKKAWERDAEHDWCKANNFMRFVADGRRFYYYGNASLEQQNLPKDSKLRLQYKDYQRVGVEDIELAEQDILKRRKEFLDVGDIAGYNRFVQNNPINELEIFRKTSVNNFNTALINEQLERINSMSHPPTSKYDLEYVKDEKTGLYKQPVEVKRVPISKDKDPNAYFEIYDGPEGFPQKNYDNRFCAGIDSYNVDQTKNSKSLGAMCVIDRKTKMVVAIIRCRPREKEIFYEMCLKLSIYYKMHHNVLGDIASDNIMKHFETAGCYNYLAERPKKFEALSSEQMHPKWFRLTTYSKPLMVGLMQFHLNRNHDKIFFPRLLNEIADYDEIAKESDNDLADAYGIALVQDVSSEIAPRDNSEQQVDNRFDLPKFVSHGDGMRIASSTKDINIQIQQDVGFRDFLFGAERRD